MPEGLRQEWRSLQSSPGTGPLWTDTGERYSPRAVAVHPALEALGEWYHDFDALGVRVRQRGGIFQVNQRCKEPVILGMLQLALAKARRTCADRPSVLELFCADGYYTCHARRMSAGRVQGIDLDAAAVAQANAMFAALYGEGPVFAREDVTAYRPAQRCDVLINCGGLYHLADPWRLVRECRERFGPRYMVVQSAVTLEPRADDYFEHPAPGWRHGCRFTNAGLRQQLGGAGWRILVEHENELEGNERLCDRGAAYFLCEWPG